MQKNLLLIIAVFGMLLFYLRSGASDVNISNPYFTSENVHNLDYNVEFRRFGIDTYITDTNGCRFHLTGWIDVTWTGGIDNYDITMDGEGDCGDHHFVGGTCCSDCPTCEYDQEQLEKFALELLEE